MNAYDASLIPGSLYLTLIDISNMCMLLNSATNVLLYLKGKRALEKKLLANARRKWTR